MNDVWVYRCLQCDQGFWPSGVADVEILTYLLKRWPFEKLCIKDKRNVDVIYNWAVNAELALFFNKHYHHEIALTSSFWDRKSRDPDVFRTIDRIIYSEDVINLAGQVLWGKAPDYALLDKIMDSRQ